MLMFGGAGLLSEPLEEGVAIPFPIRDYREGVHTAPHRRSGSSTAFRPARRGTRRPQEPLLATVPIVGRVGHFGPGADGVRLRPLPCHARSGSRTILVLSCSERSAVMVYSIQGSSSSHKQRTAVSLGFCRLIWGSFL
jgi:hypothetical protein